MSDEGHSNWLALLMAGAAGLGGFATWIASWTGVRRDVQSLERRANSNDKKHEALERHLDEMNTGIHNVAASVARIEGKLGK